METEKQVGCEREDGLLNIHPVSETCEVCSPANVEGEVPKEECEEFVDQKQENDEYEAGCASELQNAFEQSKRDTVITNDSAEIKKLRKEGNFVLVSEHPVYCRSTDAILGTSISIRGFGPTREEVALLLKGEEESEELYIVEPVKPRAKKDKGPEPFWSARHITEILCNPTATTVLENGKTVSNKLIIYRFLQRMFERQTATEQESHYTNVTNGVGFNKADAVLLSSFAVNTADYYKSHAHVQAYALTDKQALKLAGKLKKYVKGQLVEIANESTQNMPDAVTQRSIQDVLRPPNIVSPDGDVLATHLDQVLPFHDEIDAKVDELKAANPTKYYDPFDEGETMTEEAAREFWTKRFGGNA
jgi:hypothetical protein